ncbi:hypothetical protein [Methylobacterium iners]|uniref:Uncharacterized protein n=1 Tax=Methylobacterium iners TaxID=418707 RepID=A0ABQ4S2I4_9HYPH|nr:hypothetical protein [Methylobacterium iners]GJD97341.1 hypothetical protein OCOJLMKI_4570 [Methylobacterium iners]
MAYIIAGANLLNRALPTIAVTVGTAATALAKVTGLEANGYFVRVSTLLGDDVLISDLQTLASSEGSRVMQTGAPDPRGSSY